VDLCLGAHPFRLVARAVDRGGKIQIGGENLSAAEQTRGRRWPTARVSLAIYKGQLPEHFVLVSAGPKSA
jgi:hypothetical protein